MNLSYHQSSLNSSKSPIVQPMKSPIDPPCSARPGLDHDLTAEGLLGGSRAVGRPDGGADRHAEPPRDAASHRPGRCLSRRGVDWKPLPRPGSQKGLGDEMFIRLESPLPSGKLYNIAIENGHRNSGFSHKKWWFSIVKLPEGIKGESGSFWFYLSMCH